MLLLVLGILLPAAAAQAAQPSIAVPEPCRAGECRPAVFLGDPPVQGAIVEVDWRHDGAPDQGFRAQRTLLCVLPGAAVMVPGLLPTTPCTATGPTYEAAGATNIVVRITPVGGAPAFTVRRVSVIAARGGDPDTGSSGCDGLGSGEQCGDGGGRRTAGGGEKVSHVGWPAITGVLWKVVASGGRHTRTGTSRNDELLGHHGNDVLSGGAGRDVLWGDWDPRNNSTRQVDRLAGGAGADWIYSSHGRNTINGGSGKDYIWAYYGSGTIDCGPGFDTVRIRIGAPYRVRNCERVKNFCAFGSKPGNQGGCYQPGEKPR